MNTCLRHSLAFPWYSFSSTLRILASSQTKQAISFHLEHALLIIRSFFCTPFSIYLSTSNSFKVGNLSTKWMHVCTWMQCTHGYRSLQYHRCKYGWPRHYILSLLHKLPPNHFCTSPLRQTYPFTLLNVPPPLNKTCSLPKQRTYFLSLLSSKYILASIISCDHYVLQ